MVRRRVELARATSALGAGISSADVAVGARLLQHLISTNGACAQDPRCVAAAQVLAVAARGSAADRRTALTRLQTLLQRWTEEDADVAADESTQTYRRRLHLLLDHG